MSTGVAAIQSTERRMPRLATLHLILLNKTARRRSRRAAPPTECTREAAMSREAAFSEDAGALLQCREVCEGGDEGMRHPFSRELTRWTSFEVRIM